MGTNDDHLLYSSIESRLILNDLIEGAEQIEWRKEVCKVSQNIHTDSESGGKLQNC
jgi:hypothetical protein